MTDDPTISFGGAPASNPAANPAPPPPPSLLTVWGPFELLSRAGAGGFGEVYRAWDPHLQREIALKLLLPNAVAGEEAWQAMLREARALASVRHPNIVPVYGIDRHQERVGFWTDYIRGKTLAAIVRDQGPFGYREAALIGIDICRALAAVHAAGLLHRDIKPENVMREEGGRILLMDFGLSTLPHAGATLAGTQSFMAPELFRGAAATVASDLYAVGILLYFLVSGAHPARLTGLSAREATEAIAHRKPLIDLRPDLPDTFVRTVSTALEIDPTCRYQSAGQLAEALTSSLNSGITSTHAVFHPEAPTSSLPYGGQARTPSSGQPAFQSITPTHTPNYTPQPFSAGAATTNAAPPPHNFRAALEATATEALVTATTKVKTIQWTKKKIALVLLASWLLYKIFFGCDSSSRSKSNDDDGKSDKAAIAAATSALHIPKPPPPTGPAYTRFVQAQGLLEQSYKQANISAALDQFQKLTDDDEDFALGWAGLAEAHFDLYQTQRDPKLLDQATTEANKAIEIDDECVPALITLARLAAQGGNNALAIGTAGKAIGLDPTNPEARAALAQAKANEGKYDEAAQTMQEAIDRAPDDWRFPSALGDIYMRAGQAPTTRRSNTLPRPASLPITPRRTTTSAKSTCASTSSTKRKTTSCTPLRSSRPQAPTRNSPGLTSPKTTQAEPSRRTRRHSNLIRATIKHGRTWARPMSASPSPIPAPSSPTGMPSNSPKKPVRRNRRTPISSPRSPTTTSGSATRNAAARSCGRPWHSRQATPKSFTSAAKLPSCSAIVPRPST